MKDIEWAMLKATGKCFKNAGATWDGRDCEAKEMVKKNLVYDKEGRNLRCFKRSSSIQKFDLLLSFLVYRTIFTRCVPLDIIGSLKEEQ